MDSPTKQELAIGFAFIAWLFVITSMWLPWWVINYTTSAGHRYAQDQAFLWQPKAELTTAAAPWITGFIVAILSLWLFVRLASRAWHHEPKVWQRDLLGSAIMSAVALISTMFWPDFRNYPAFWGGRRLALENESVSFTETALPGLGWWCTLVALLLLLAAYALTRPAPGGASGK